MRASDPILRVGLTGGIASGKTTVADILAGMGVFVIDADAVAHAVMLPGAAAYDRVVQQFGTTILDQDGSIVRRRVADIVFHDSQARQALNAIVHPEVMAESGRRIADHAPKSKTPIAVFDAALLVESGLYREFHKLIVASAGRQTQIRRLLVRDAMPTNEAEARIDAQAPLSDKLTVADYVVDTEGTLRDTHKQTERVHAALLLDFEQKFGERG